MAEMITTPRWGPQAPLLSAEGLVLTALRADDAHALLAMDRDPEVARRFGWDPGGADLAKCAEHISRTWRWWATGERAGFAVRDSVEGPLLGMVEARRENDGRIELSWITVPGQRQRGIASRGARAVCRWCLMTGAEAVWATVEPDNEASIRVARSTGMAEHRRDEHSVRLVVR